MRGRLGQIGLATVPGLPDPWRNSGHAPPPPFPISDYTQWLSDAADSPDGEVFGALYEELKMIARLRG